MQIESTSRKFFKKSEAFRAIAGGHAKPQDLDIFVVPVDLRYYKPNDDHTSLGDVPKNALCGDAVQLSGISFSDDNVLDADDVTVTHMRAGAPLGLLLYANEGPRLADKHILLINSVCWPMPRTPGDASGVQVSTGGDLEITWDDGPLKIARIRH